MFMFAHDLRCSLHYAINVVGVIRSLSDFQFCSFELSYYSCSHTTLISLPELHIMFVILLSGRVSLSTLFSLDLYWLL